VKRRDVLKNKKKDIPSSLTCNNMGKHGGEMKEDLLKQDYVYHYDESGE
jgi:hypothetical protein